MNTVTTWAVILAAALGLAIGVGAYTFVYAKGASYLTNDPAACANCHIMSEHYGAWLKSSHRSVATCNDCHTPSGLVPKYVTKGLNGFWHSFYFTTGRFPDPLRITPRNHDVTETRCRECHQAIVSAMVEGDHAPGGGPDGGGEASASSDDLSCVRCHRHVGHWVR